MKLIVGLGNPKEEFIGTRHNLGFEVVDHLAHKLADGTKVTWESNPKLKAEIIKTSQSDLSDQLLLAKPQTYMNKSGLAVAALARFYKIADEDILIIHDDLDLKLGQLKIRKGGSAAGHHGVESVIENLGQDDFVRLRLGIKPYQLPANVEHFVVSSFVSAEKSTVKRMIKRASEAIQTWLKEGLAKAQNQYH